MDVPMRLAAATFRISERLARSLACGATGAAMMPPSIAGEGDACPRNHGARVPRWQPSRLPARADSCDFRCDAGVAGGRWPTLGPCRRDRKSTRLNSSHEWISYAVFCLKKKKKK